MFVVNGINQKNKNRQADIASLVLFEIEMCKIQMDMKVVSNVPNPHVNHNKYIENGFIYRNVTYNKQVNYISKNHIVILPSSSADKYQTMWNITNTLLTFISSLEEKKVTIHALRSTIVVAHQYQETFKNIISIICKRPYKKILQNNVTRSLRA